jgi:hypothetical protein
MKHEYREGPEAREKFDEGMSKLFRAPKVPIKAVKTKPARKPSRVKNLKSQ